MAKATPTKQSEAFGKRLTALIVRHGQERRGAGAYLAQRYKVTGVTANAWLKGEHMPKPELARRIAEDHGSTFDELTSG